MYLLKIGIDGKTFAICDRIVMGVHTLAAEYNPQSFSKASLIPLYSTGLMFAFFTILPRKLSC